MKYNFDKIINRADTNSVSYEGWKKQFPHFESLKLTYPENDMIKFWVADMALASPPEVLDAMRQRLTHEIIGYSNIFDPNYYLTLSKWFEKRYHYSLDPKKIVLSPGVVPSLNYIVDLTLNKNDQILITTPSYAPFKRAGDLYGKTVFYTKLKINSNQYVLDLNEIEALLTNKLNNIKLFFFCNPHNPTGKVWSELELTQVAQLCVENDVWLVSDEIHCDLIRNGKEFISMQQIIPDYAKLITCTAPSKTFNLAGNNLAQIIINDEALIKKWQQKYHYNPSPLGIAGTLAAYSLCEQWLNELNEYLDNNLKIIKNAIATHLPEASFIPPEATYLAWIDLSFYLDKLGVKDADVNQFFVEKAGVVLDSTAQFIDNYSGHIRLNFACPQSMLEIGLNRIIKALN